MSYRSSSIFPQRNNEMKTPDTPPPWRPHFVEAASDKKVLEAILGLSPLFRADTSIGRNFSI